MGDVLMGLGFIILAVGIILTIAFTIKNFKNHDSLNKLVISLIVGILGLVILVIGAGIEPGPTAIDSDSDTDSNTVQPEKTSKSNNQSRAVTDSFADKADSSSKESDVPREYKNAVSTVNDYQEAMGDMSYQGLMEQLTSEDGEGYPQKAAEYALSHVKIDYNQNALECAKNYQENIPMSDQQLMEQLTSQDGEGFTQEQAQYAMDHLED